MTSLIDGAAAANDPRKLAAARWAATTMGMESILLAPVSDDASFRRYFRFQAGNRSVILMDAPPEKEDSAPFIDIAHRLRQAGLRAPRILEFDLHQGFGLLEDFGDTLYRELIDTQSAGELFPSLFSLLNGMARNVSTAGLPPYSEQTLLDELDLFSAWYLQLHKKRVMDANERRTWNKICRLLTESALQQPQVFVHKDFHSCNLLHTSTGPGIIDFQDAMLGPVSYDFASLIWDRYIAWPRDQIEDWMREVHAILPVECNLPEWIRFCDWMGLQRNLKIVGIFARLKYRDGKDGYLEMIPRFYQYLLDVLSLYPELNDFQLLLEQNECAP